MSHHPDRLTEPLIRKDGISKHDTDIDPANPYTHFRKATWEEALDRAAEGLRRIRDRDGRRALAGFGSRQGLERGGLPVPEAGSHRVRQQQCRSLHAALPCLLGRAR